MTYFQQISLTTFKHKVSLWSLLSLDVTFCKVSMFSGLSKPKLSVTPSVVKEQDLVTVDCLFPSAVSDQCYFLFTRKQSTKILSCSSTVTGTDLLLMSQQTSPAKVELKCFYTVKFKDSNLPSPHSDTSSIIVHSKSTMLLWIINYSISMNCWVDLNMEVEYSEAISFLICICCNNRFIIRSVEIRSKTFYLCNMYLSFRSSSTYADSQSSCCLRERVSHTHLSSSIRCFCLWVLFLLWKPKIYQKHLLSEDTDRIRAADVTADFAC